jgi:hypothetical protein
MPSAEQPTKGKRGPAKMTDEHKAALAAGREQSRHVSAYLDALEAHKPKRGRKRTPDSIKNRLVEIEAALPTATGIKKLELAQSKLDLEAELAAKDVAVDLTELRKNFVKHASSYGKRKGISYGAWREAGVSAADLKDAGISRAG